MISTKERTNSRTRGSPNHPHNTRSRHLHGGLPHPTKQAGVRRYQQQPKPGNAQRVSTTLPNPVIVRPRVQAGAGDKCVAPAKSKLKQRRSVPGRPKDESALSMDAVLWSEQTYNVQQLVHAYGERLPIIVKVTQGFHGNGEEDDLSINQVVQIHSYDKQRRVRASTEHGGARITIPADYPMEVHIKDEVNRKEERVAFPAALNNFRFPFRAQVTSVNEDIEVSTVNVLGRQLLFKDEYTDLFLRVNTINDGWVDQYNIHAIPASFGAEFAVAVGMRGALEHEWEDYTGMFSRSVRHLKFNLISGFEGIIIDDDGGGSVVVERPRSSMIQAGQGPVYENLAEEKRASTMDPRPSSSRNSHPYENWQKRPTGRLDSDGVRPSDVITRQESVTNNNNKKARPITMDVEDDVFIIPMSSTRPQSMQDRQESQDGSIPEGRGSQSSADPRVPLSPLKLPDVVTGESRARSSRPSTPFSEVDEQDVEEMFQSVLDVAAEQETLEKNHSEQEERRIREKQKHLETEKQMELQRLRKKSQREHKSQAPVSATPTSPVADVQPRFFTQQQQQEESERAAILARGQRLDSQKKTISPFENGDLIRRDNSQRSHNVESTSQDIALLHRGFSNKHQSYRSSSSSHESKDHELVPIQAEVHRSPSSSSRQPTTDDRAFQLAHSPSNRKRSFRSDVHPSKLERPPTHPRAMAHHSPQSPRMIAISISDERDLNANKPGDPRTQSTSAITSMEDVPALLDTLSVDDICKCLELLSLDKNIAVFRRQKVDGNILTGLTEMVLSNRFQMTPFDASKLMRFVRGWRPPRVS